MTDVCLNSAGLNAQLSTAMATLFLKWLIQFRYSLEKICILHPYFFNIYGLYCLKENSFLYICMDVQKTMGNLRDSNLSRFTFLISYSKAISKQFIQDSLILYCYNKFNT